MGAVKQVAVLKGQIAVAKSQMGGGTRWACKGGRGGRGGGTRGCGALAGGGGGGGWW